MDHDTLRPHTFQSSPPSLCNAVHGPAVMRGCFTLGMLTYPIRLSHSDQMSTLRQPNVYRIR